jgi:glycosyltransferase involved in cell wall biosynthesis
MIEKKLEILIITYNRSKDLENTFKQLIKSPFAKCKIIVLDNCSEDDTPAICVKYQKQFPKMDIIRHKKNIGAAANYLRAVELSESIYSWVLCDDDNLDFSDCSDIIEAIETQKFDLISVGHPSYSNWERGVKTTTKKLIDSGATYFTTLSFIPSSIYKTELYDSLCLHKSYDNIYTLFPHFAFITKSIEDNFSIYISKKEVVIRGDHNNPRFSSLEWLNGWINSCSLIKNREIRQNAAREISFGSFLIKKILLAILSEKFINNEKSFKNYLMFLSGTVSTFGFSKDILLMPLAIPLILVPAWMYKNTVKLCLIFIFGKKYKKRIKISQQDQDAFR